METRVQRYGDATAHARHGTPLQDDSIVQYNYGLVRRYMALCGLVARLNQAWSDWGGKPSSKKSFSCLFLCYTP